VAESIIEIFDELREIVSKFIQDPLYYID